MIDDNGGSEHRQRLHRKAGSRAQGDFEKGKNRAHNDKEIIAMDKDCRDSNGLQQ